MGNQDEEGVVGDEKEEEGPGWITMIRRTGKCRETFGVAACE